MTVISQFLLYDCLNFLWSKAVIVCFTDVFVHHMVSVHMFTQTLYPQLLFSSDVPELHIWHIIIIIIIIIIINWAVNQ